MFSRLGGTTSLGSLPGRFWRSIAPSAPFLSLLVFATLSMLGGYLLGRRGGPRSKPDRLDIYVLNVQNGEAAWMRTPAGHVIVIGAGPPGSGARLVNDLQRAGVKKIDLLALPYPYAEAIGGASDLLMSIPVSQVIDSGGPVVNQWQDRLRALCRSRAIPLRSVVAGDQILVDTAHVSVLAPAAARVTASPAAANNSLVLKIRWRETMFVWAGGLERAGEDALLSRVPDLSATWLRVARFGSRSASSAEFLMAVSPEMAVISAGQNAEGYPHAETMQRLHAAGARIYQTAATPTHLHFYSDGAHVSFSSDP